MHTKQGLYAGELKAKVEASQKTVQSSYSKLSGLNQIEGIPLYAEEQILFVKQEKQKIEEFLNEIKQKIARKKLLEEAIPLSEKNLDSHADNKIQCENSIASIIQEINYMQSEKEKLASSLMYENKEKAREHIDGSYCAKEAKGKRA